MSNLTQIRVKIPTVFVILTAALGFFSVHGFVFAWADDSSAGDGFASAQQQLSKSFNDYYNSVRDSPNQTKEEAGALFQRHVAQSAMHVSELAHENTTQAYQKLGIQILAEEQKPVSPEKMKIKDLLAALRGDGGGAANGTTGMAGLPAQPEKPEIALDGSKIPKELEFRGKTQHHSHSQSQSQTNRTPASVKQTTPAAGNE